MSTFEVKVYRLVIESHPNAHSLELARVGDYLSVVRKDQFKTGDLAVYIPEQAIVPAAVLEEMGLAGKLAGANKDRVKATKLRGILSQGLIYPNKGWAPGQDVTTELGITKFEPPVPVHLAGDVGSGAPRFKFDVENIKKFPDVFSPGEIVVMTEKIHGSCLILAHMPPHMRKPDMIDGRFVVISKGLAEDGLYFKDNEKNATNSYVKCLRDTEVLARFGRYVPDEYHLPVYMVGELVGVQDMKYGVAEGKLQFRMFGVKVGDTWTNWEDLESMARLFLIPLVPVVYRGPFSKEVLYKHTQGKEQVTGRETHFREGVVVYPIVERTHRDIGRVFLKSISEEYSLRKNGTEYT